VTRWQRELKKISEDNDGILKAEDVVKFAKNKKTALHKKFTWDDNKAAHQYRLWQARELIRVTVELLPHDNKEHKAWVSIERDRYTPGGGYRALVDVMSDETLRNLLLDQAFREFESWKAKYVELKELAPIFAAAKRVNTKRKTKKKAKKKPSRRKK
jgi:hypothetical protein